MPSLRRVDNNHAEIAQALRQVGCVVIDLHEVGRGVPDLLAARAGVLYLLEVKDGSKPASGRKLTPQEADTVRLLGAVGCTVHVVINVEGALRAVGAIL